MSKLALYILAASAAFIPAAASAQMHHPGGTAVTVRHGGPGMGMGHHGRFMHPGPNFRHHRLHRGFVINPFWFGPQFHIQNWQMYGFAPPPAGHRWVRYYDDAYLIDREGRVRDERYGLDWDQYGERWEMDDGIPSYYGRGDYRPDDEDYGWVERHGGGGEDWDYGDAGVGYGPPPGCGPAPCGGGGEYGAAYGGGYGYYGYGVAYPIIIETTVTTGAASYVEEVTEEVVEVRSRPRHYRPRPHCNCPPPRRPPPGERG